MVFAPTIMMPSILCSRTNSTFAKHFSSQIRCSLLYQQVTITAVCQYHGFQYHATLHTSAVFQPVVMLRCASHKLNICASLPDMYCYLKLTRLQVTDAPTFVFRRLDLLTTRFHRMRALETACGLYSTVVLREV